MEWVLTVLKRESLAPLSLECVEVLEDLVLKGGL